MALISRLLSSMFARLVSQTALEPATAPLSPPPGPTVVPPIPVELDESAVDIMARTCWGEARGEGRPGIEAVASVIMNRANNPRWWGSGVKSVCLKQYQFSCWLVDDPNHDKLTRVDKTNAAFVLCLEVCRAAMRGKLADPTNGADHYYDTSIPSPSWAVDKVPTLVRPPFRFFRLELQPPKGNTP